MIINTETNTEAPVRRSQRNRTRMDYSQLANSGDRVEIEEVQNPPPTPDIAQTVRQSPNPTTDTRPNS